MRFALTLAAAMAIAAPAFAQTAAPPSPLAIARQTGDYYYQQLVAAQQEIATLQQQLKVEQAKHEAPKAAASAAPK